MNKLIKMLILDMLNELKLLLTHLHHYFITQFWITFVGLLASHADGTCRDKYSTPSVCIVYYLNGLCM